jgi:Argininosuccinate synthase
MVGAVYEDKYLLGPSFARPIIAKKLVEIGLIEGADAVALGAVGQGSYQVRFALTGPALAANIALIAPWRAWDLDSRAVQIRVCREARCARRDGEPDVLHGPQHLASFP